MDRKQVKCQCGAVFEGADAAEAASLVIAHIAEEHPDKRLPGLEETTHAIGKARMFGPQARATMVLYPRKE